MYIRRFDRVYPFRLVRFARKGISTENQKCPHVPGPGGRRLFPPLLCGYHCGDSMVTAAIPTSTADVFPEPLPRWRNHVSLALCTVAHSFLHAFGSMLVPLYLLMTRDLRLGGVQYAALLVTVYGAVYNLGSYFAGMAADRFNRARLLGIGLLGNAIAIILIGFTRNYSLLLLWSALTGVSATIFHPTANSLVTSHYPRNPGLAIGLLGIVSGVGFFLGPQFSGWQARPDTWTFLHVADWQRPCIQLGVCGLIAAIVIYCVAHDTRPTGHYVARKLPKEIRNRVLLLAIVLGWRDFAGVAMISLSAIYLQKACGMTTAHVGFIIGAMMLLSVVVNPLSVAISPGRRRLPTLTAVLIAGGIIVATTSLWPVRWVLIAMSFFMTMQLGSYALSDAATFERVPGEIRGRVSGLFLTIAGTLGATGPWAMGFWTDAMHQHATERSAYLLPFITLGAAMIFSALAPHIIAKLGPTPMTQMIDPISETMPESIGALG
jgi:MFS family permease